MSLNLTEVAAQVAGMISRLKEGRVERQQHLQAALDTINNKAINLDDLKKKIAASRTSWLVAELVEGLGSRYPAASLR